MAETQLVQRPYFNVKTFGFWVVVLVGLVVGFTNPWAPGLTPLGHKVLMGLIIAVGLWVFKPANIPFSVSGCLLMMIYLFYGINPTKVFSGFTSNALWVLIPALYFGFVLAKTGLGKRISYLVIKAFKPSYAGLMIAWVIIGLLLSALTPSIAVRVAIVMPLALSCVEVCKLEPRSPGRALILLTAWAMALLPGTGWLTGSLWGPIVMGMFNATPALNGLITFDSWSKVAFLPLEIMSLLLIVGGYFALRPAQPISISKEIFEAEYAKLGPMSRSEKAAGMILLICFILFATSQIHHIPDAAICLGGLFALTAAGVIKTQELGTGISWDLVIFIGVAMSLGAVFADAGVSKWLSSVLVPMLDPISGNSWIFVFAVVFFLFLWRFIDIAVLIPTMAIVTPIIPEIAASYGVNPLVWITIFVMAGNCFFLSYQNMFALIGESIVGDKGWTPAQFAKYGFVYLVACIVALLIAIPYWTSLGMFD
ncbi:SLC13 family permease [Syntrophothermus sp.]|uniref:SLC13 family permease n=1 Tax=Syntrophothermus sp. TaxID=2736299 RepID=UPI00257CCD6F|nr:SLC13 family permease [Syntrophothermus sp.]